MSESAPFYLSGRTIFKRPEKTASGVTMGFPVCEVDEYVDPPEAVLSLLNAASDMLAALKKIACPHVTENPLWWQAEARAAIAKARGETP